MRSPARCLTALLICLFFLSVRAQENPEVHLTRKVTSAATDAEKIRALGELAEYYTAYRLHRQADSIQQQQLLIAQLSANRELILQALFEHSITDIHNWSNLETFDRALAFVEKGLNYAREERQYDYEAIALIRKSSLLRKKGDLQQAMQEAMLAFSALDKAGNDSLRAELYLELGNIMLEKDDAVAAYRNFNMAYQLAYSMKNAGLLSGTYYHFAMVYDRLNNNELSENYLLRSVKINRENRNSKGLLNDYLHLSRFTEKKEYILEFQKLADEQRSFRHQLWARELILAYFMAVEKDSDKALRYLESQPALKQSYINKGAYTYEMTLGDIYLYGNKPQAALDKYLPAVNSIGALYETGNSLQLLKDIGTCYRMLGEPEKAIQYFEKAGALAGSLSGDTALTANLSALYAATGNYRRAYEYQLLFQEGKQELQLLADGRQVALLDVEREQKRQEKDLQIAEENKLRRKNLQYMGISIAIALFFLVLVLAGMFPVSRFIIRVLGFFAFICLFEFIIVMISSYLYRITGGEPLQVWLFKVALIAVLLPLHHYLEHAVVSFLESQQLIKLREQISIAGVIRKFRSARGTAEQAPSATSAWVEDEIK